MARGEKTSTSSRSGAESITRRPSFHVTPPTEGGGSSHSRKDKSQMGTWPGPTLHATLEGQSIISIGDDGEESVLSLPSQIMSADSLSGHRPPTRDKAAQVLGLRRSSMEAIPTSRVTPRPSNISARSASYTPATPAAAPPIPLTSLYVVSGLPKSASTWTLADPDSVLGLHHSDGAVGRWWRAEVLGSTVSPGCVPPSSIGVKKRKSKEEKNGAALGLGKQDVGRMLSKALKLSFTREVEIIASTLQPASTVHTFTFNIPASSTSTSPSSLLRSSVISSGTSATFPDDHGSTPYLDPVMPRPSSTYLGPSSATAQEALTSSKPSNVQYYGVCLTVWSHADQERSIAIRKTLEAASRARKESGPILSSAGGIGKPASFDPTSMAKRLAKRSLWSGTDGETDAETEEGASESDLDSASKVGESTLFLPGDTVFWLPYALTLVSRFPCYDLMRDYLTLSWARFSKDVQSHTLQIAKILSTPAPKTGELIKLDASAKDGQGDGSLEVVCRMPGGLDFSRGLVDVNFTMWPLFSCLSLDNILTICEIALAPTGRILFLSRHPALLGIAVSTVRYLVELRGWNGIALPIVHARDSKIYLEDPGPWLIGLNMESRYAVRPSSEVCICDLDINYVTCSSPPPGAISTKQQRERYRRILGSAFDTFYHPDHSVPSEFKEAFPAGRFRPLCKIQTKRGASASVVADNIKAPDWWHSTRVIQAFDAVLQDKTKKPSLLKRLVLMGVTKRQAHLTAAEQLIQASIRKRATAFVDARDDLETKIGRLSRRLNFLMTESDLWRDKFVTFEQYAEKLSVEAAELRAKINKEQRESKRLSSLISLTGQEKVKLQTQLSETEGAHREALVELDKMKATMDRMEDERAQMVAEVEAQIERALASMVVSDGEIEDFDMDPGTPRTPHSAYPSRPSSAHGHRLRSFGTASTLAARDDPADLPAGKLNPEQLSETEQRTRRVSASRHDGHDGMNAVDSAMAESTDKISQKVLAIQQKLENALASDNKTTTRRRTASQGSEIDSRKTTTRPPRPPRGIRLAPVPPRLRSHTTESTPTMRISTLPPPSEDTIPEHEVPASVRKSVSMSAMRASSNESPPATASSPVPITPSVTTDDSDTDFQSAYSASAFGSDDDAVFDPDVTLHNGVPTFKHDVTLDEPTKFPTSGMTGSLRPRSSSTATAKTGSSANSPASSEANTITSISAPSPQKGIKI